jgi:hypothetical protein
MSPTEAALLPFVFNNGRQLIELDCQPADIVNRYRSFTGTVWHLIFRPQYVTSTERTPVDCEPLW